MLPAGTQSWADGRKCSHGASSQSLRTDRSSGFNAKSPIWRYGSVPDPMERASLKDAFTLRVHPELSSSSRPRPLVSG